MEVNFENFFKDFLDNLESSYIEYFYIISRECDIDIDENIAKNIALNYLKNLSESKSKIGSLAKLNLFEVAKDGTKLDFMITKSTLYIYEKFIEYMKNKDEKSLVLIEKLTQHLKYFYNSLKNGVDENIENYSSKVGFGYQNHVYSNNNILDIFSKLKDDGKNIQFMNLYQGIPISYEGKILEIDGESVVFEIENELQEIAMKLEGKAYMIKNDYLNRYVKADILYSNFSNKTIVLHNFVYLLNLPAIQREFTRIYPDIFVQVTLESEKNIQLKGNLYDLSMGGLGLISKDNEGFFPNAKIDIKFKLTLSDREFHVNTKGEILNIIEYLDSYRYCIKIFPDTKNLQKIKKYIKSRELKIIEELKEELNSYIF